ncbi:hypothetical protein BABINDRAFT_176586 [Babjeviella inositovora NRRL Y-12698]|uniref:Uncharacterized protein n=1 Tax=Babjeviella inositovora NRRL Y-12698 TaxID=984486 RepID=A0A1E3QMY7_9ASCO|nr:uncharacterized protein BABINDRAFT_176586 [Babjeviella inositovora NRRL Y-12698]ODQ79000.1 hypothetical protein BABINDRAFT_176586 [Babjeviella inositovora NRRL Y-12698]
MAVQVHEIEQFHESVESFEENPSSSEAVKGFELDQPKKFFNLRSASSGLPASDSPSAEEASGVIGPAYFGESSSNALTGATAYSAILQERLPGLFSEEKLASQISAEPTAVSKTDPSGIYTPFVPSSAAPQELFLFDSEIIPLNRPVLIGPSEGDLIVLTQLLYECDKLVILISQKLTGFLSRVLRRNQLALLSSNYRQKSFHFKSKMEKDPEENHSEFRVDCKSILSELNHIQKCSFKKFDKVWKTITVSETSRQFYNEVTNDLIIVVKNIPTLLENLETYPDYSVFLTEMLISSNAYKREILGFIMGTESHLEEFAAKNFTQYLSFNDSVKSIKQALDQLNDRVGIAEKMFDSFNNLSFDIAHYVEYLKHSEEYKATFQQPYLAPASTRLHKSLSVIVKYVQQLEFMAFNIARGCYDDIGRVTIGDRYNRVTDGKKVYKTVEKKDGFREYRTAVFTIAKLSTQVKPRIEYLGGVLKILETLSSADTPYYEMHWIMNFTIPLAIGDFALARNTFKGLTI